METTNPDFQGSRKGILAVCAIAAVLGIAVMARGCDKVYDTARAAHDAKIEQVAADGAAAYDGAPFNGTKVKASANGKTLTVVYDLGLKDGERLPEIQKAALPLDWKTDALSVWCKKSPGVDIVKASVEVKLSLVAGPDTFTEVVDKAACGFD